MPEVKFRWLLLLAYLSGCAHASRVTQVHRAQAWDRFRTCTGAHWHELTVNSDGDRAVAKLTYLQGDQVVVLPVYPECADALRAYQLWRAQELDEVDQEKARRRGITCTTVGIITTCHGH
jgi:hypothetical protein